MFKTVFTIRMALSPVFFSALILAGIWSLLGTSKAATHPSLAPVPNYFERALSPSLSSDDIALYKDILALQKSGKMAQADVLIKQLSDRELMGHVLYQRYMHDSYISNFTELKSWLALYADHPEADKVYGLAQRRMPKDFKGELARPVAYKPMVTVQKPVQAKIYVSEKDRNGPEKKAFNDFNKKVLTLVSDHKVDKAVHLLETKAGNNFLDQTEYDQLQAAIAAEALYSGREDRAYNLAKVSWQRSGETVPLAGWVAGLAAWDNGQYRKAAQYFETTASSSYTKEWMIAGAHYWAARARKQSGDVLYSVSLKKAAQYPRTFYGLIATTALGHDFDFNWAVPEFSKKYYDILSTVPAGRRALALAAIGETQLAEAELLRINPDDMDTRDAMMSFAAYQGMPVLAMRLGGSDKQSAFYDAASYPKTSLVPQGGYKIDPALIHAIAHQESKFNPNARSSKGATGLMQLMPATASAMAGQSDLIETNGFSLKDPKTNLELGQLYLRDLLGNKNVNGDLVSLLIAYNAGPGNLARWKKQNDAEDPLLFVETIPYGETRSYVRNVLANYWIYSLRGQSSVSSLDAIAKGAPAIYETPVTDGYEFASRY